MRSTCAIARLVKMWWDDKLIEALESMNIKRISGARSMDNIRVWLDSVRLGWRLVDGEMIYDKRYAEDN